VTGAIFGEKNLSDSNEYSEVLVANSQYLQEKILNYVGNKHIYIIGSSVNLQDVQINAPILVRLNSSRRWGDCDIWFNNQSQDTKFQLDSEGSFKDKFIIRANGDRQGSNMLRNYPSDFLSRTFFWHPSEWERMTKEMKIERPLTGTIAAYWFHKYTGNEITLVNYDFYRKVKRHTVRGIPQPAPVHNPEQDHEFLNSLDRISWEKAGL
jgi:hypothetical protein